jgi:thiol-disulfide isomerase/thioredoxin
MKSLRPVFVAALLLASGAGTGAVGAPPTDAQIDAAVKAFQGKEREAAAQGGPERATDPIKWADDALEGIDLAAITPEQINTLLRSHLLPTASKSRIIADHLGEVARLDTVEGADAAAIRLSFLRFEPDASAQQLMIRRALTHPKLQAALKEGKAYSLFFSLSSARKELLPEILALKDVLTTDMPPEVAARAYQVVDAVVALTGDDDAATREPLRAKTLEMVRAAMKHEGNNEALREALSNAEKKLDGAFMKGELIGHPAPDLTITWTNMEPAIKSLADLKGKVVVMDFWATWCGPCVAAFPDVKKLQAHYEGYPVVLLGVTSLQGFHVSGPKIGEDGTVIAETRSIDCKDDPEKEMKLMGEYIKERGITWKIAFSKESVFNSEYGVYSIPHVVIIDAKGNVRYRRLHPNDKAVPMIDKVRMIDGLLREAGLPTPPPPPREDLDPSKAR